MSRWSCIAPSQIRPQYSFLRSCVGPLSFYGPSLPEYFCKCKMKFRIYDGEPNVKALIQNKDKSEPISVPFDEHLDKEVSSASADQPVDMPGSEKVNGNRQTDIPKSNKVATGLDNEEVDTKSDTMPLESMPFESTVSEESSSEFENEGHGRESKQVIG
jgi:hypothetical protein